MNFVTLCLLVLGTLAATAHTHIAARGVFADASEDQTVQVWDMAIGDRSSSRTMVC
ncbi:MAG: hypothetical protein M3Z08_19765 [Chloroflexota bacterium]|nr:hypothetical protein [Chloroflexota bacterium]